MEITHFDVGQRAASQCIEIYYRYDANIHYDWNGNLNPDGSFLFYHECQVIRKTKCGVWVYYYGEEKLVIHSHKKKFAYPNKKAALESYYLRKERQVKILETQLAKAKVSLALTKDINGNSITR